MIDTTHLSDVHVLACTLYGEARSESTEGILAVACVIRNRVTAGSDYRSVCLHPDFACWTVGPLTAPNTDGKQITTNHGRLAQLVADLKVGPVVDERYRECAWIATGVVNNWVRDTAHGADHYHKEALVDRPAWTKGMVPLNHIHQFPKTSYLFYRLAPLLTAKSA